MMHKWWARKPHNVVGDYVEAYSEKEDVVLDPFCGSGVTAAEALRRGRKAVAIDLNPVATFITKMTIIPAGIDKITATFEQIEKDVSGGIQELYETKCRKCGSSAETVATIWNATTRQPTEIRYHCPHCKKNIGKKPDESEIKKILNFEKRKPSHWYPKDRLAYNGTEFKEGTHLADLGDIPSLFTGRNLEALSILYDSIGKIKDQQIKDLMKFRFTSMVHLASKMTPVRPTRPMSSFWPVHRYWVPAKYMESNVWLLFESAIKGRQGLIAGKNDSNNAITEYVEAKTFEDLKGKANIYIKTQTAIRLEGIPDGSIDYVFTDPPYGGSIQYFELSTLWASWLRGPENDHSFQLDFDGEITINDKQNKDFEYYHKMLRASFDEVYRVLKPGRWLTVTFHNTDIKIYNSIIKAVVLAGFDLEKVIYQSPARMSAKGLLQPYGSAVGDYYIRFSKAEKPRAKLEDAEVDRTRYERIVLDAVKHVIAHRGAPTPYSIIINSYPMIYEQLKANGYLFSAPESIEDVLKRNLGKELVLVSEKDAKGKVIGKKWWFKDPASVPFIERTPLSERVERTVLDVLNRYVRVSFDEVLRQVFLTFPNSLTPENETVREVLSEYAKPVKGGMWMLKKDLLQRRVREHGRIIGTLAEIGLKLGFDVWVAPNERGSIGDQALVKRLLPTLSLAHDSDKIDRIREIDVLWIRNNNIAYALEVEHTTMISEAIIRGSNITATSVKHIMLLPDERKKLLRRRVNEPALTSEIQKGNWGVVYYDDLQGFSKRNATEVSFGRLVSPLADVKIEKEGDLRSFLRSSTSSGFEADSDAE